MLHQAVFASPPSIEHTYVIWSGKGRGVTLRATHIYVNGDVEFSEPVTHRFGPEGSLYALYAGRLEGIEIENHDYEVQADQFDFQLNWIPQATNVVTIMEPGWISITTIVDDTELTAI